MSNIASEDSVIYNGLGRDISSESILFNGYMSMPVHQSLQLALWQSVCRHLDIAESTESTAVLLTEHTPLAALRILTVDSEHHRVLQTAAWPANLMDSAQREVSLADTAWRRLDRWMKQGKPLHQLTEDKSAGILELLPYPSTTAGWLLAPL